MTIITLGLTLASCYIEKKVLHIITLIFGILEFIASFLIIAYAGSIGVNSSLGVLSNLIGSFATLAAIIRLCTQEKN